MNEAMEALNSSNNLKRDGKWFFRGSFNSQELYHKIIWSFFFWKKVIPSKNQDPSLKMVRRGETFQTFSFMHWLGGITKPMGRSAISPPPLC